MSVKLRKKPNPNADGSTSIYLDIYHNGKRTYEFLKNLSLPGGSNPADRQKKKEHWDLAKKIETSRAQQLSASDYDIATDQAKKVIVTDWMDSYAKRYSKADIRVIEGVVKSFKTFLKDRKTPGLLMKDFGESIAYDFKDTLIGEHKGEGAKSYYARFKKIVKQAVRDNLLIKNPCEYLKPPSGQAKVKDVLTFEELQKVAATPTDAPEVRRAFLFSAVTGLAFVDIKALKWQNINLKERYMRLVRAKNKKFNKSEDYPLNETAITLLGEEKESDQKVFDLPTANGCNKSLTSWVKRAKIKKHITWHCGRHGYGTNLVHNGTDIYTTSQLLGHSSLAHTKRYVRASRDMNQKAVDSLPKINL